MKRIALTLALAASLMIPATALAATSNETLTVNVTRTLTGVPTDLDFGSANAGATASAPQFTINYSANTASTIDAAQTDLTSSGDTLPKGNVELKAGSGAYAAANGQIIDTIPGAGGSGSKTIDVRVNIPAAQSAGAYSGVLTLSNH